MTDSLTIIRPDDWHLHLRDGSALQHTVADAAKTFGRAIIMPNLVPPVRTASEALAYRQRIEHSIPQGRTFQPLMVLYLTDVTSVEDIRAARDAGVVACKLYPAGATTNSEHGVTDIKRIYPALEAMQEHEMRFLIHGEVTDPDIDIFDREKVFIDRTLAPLEKDFPNLRMVLEHITTMDAVDFVSSASDRIAATITAHHLLFNRNHMLAGGIRPHYYCLPILKRSNHQRRLIEAATSGSRKFFLGTDSAPHARQRKESDCGCAGAYTAYHAIELYAQAFEAAGALEKLENFASVFGPAFYDVPPNSDTITLHKSPWKVPEVLPLGDAQVKPLLAGETLQWQLQS